MPEFSLCRISRLCFCSRPRPGRKPPLQRCWPHDAHAPPLCRPGVCPGLEYDDAVQEGIIGLFSAVKMFDASRGAAFETYASTPHSKRGHCRAAGCGPQKARSPESKRAPGRNHPAPGPEEIAIRNEQMNATFQAIHTRLSGFEQEVLALFIDGNSYEQIARQLGRTPRRWKTRCSVCAASRARNNLLPSCKPGFGLPYMPL